MSAVVLYRSYCLYWHDSPFRERFEAKGRFTDFNRRIATYVVTAEQPGLLGCAVYLKQILAS